ncbi:Protein of unknown function [Enhydrobacter aerosaccus]|uniref:DUF4239 domain-containing protein n=1 Tax=Enhydrobacter aerosaccus TaxID=225324 RepID=A0A1T4NGF3_9HYPH|nr:DUF4239 domain-containing protein [Enhydrobacter aerosaccus]SJZ77828.1 Protein of unknown function [Enhydrobacter aerosaccus]
MIDWLYTFPELLLLILPVTTLVLLMVVLPRLIHRIPWLTPSDGNTDFVLRMQATLFTMTSLVLTFTLVQADINFRQADNLVSSEAAKIDQLDRLLTRYGDESARDVRPLLHAYARSIVEKEWPAMLKDKGDPETGKAFAPISRRILTINPTNSRETLILGEMLKALDTIADARASRLNMITIALPPIYWIVVCFAICMLLFVSSTIQQTPFRTTVLAAQAAVVGAFLGFVFTMDQPFKGETAIGPDAIVQVLARMEARTE